MSPSATSPLSVAHRRATPRERHRLVVFAALAYTAIAAALTVVAEYAEDSPWRPDGVPQASDLPMWLDAWYRWDAGWYFSIAEHGYYYTPGGQSSVAFFPAYPTAVRLLSAGIGNTGIAAWLVSVAFGLVAVLLTARWVADRLSLRTAVVAVGLLLLYPYAVFLYGPMYGESLFLATAVGAFLALDRGHFLAAGVLGFIATAGRPVGVAVAVGLLVRMLELRAERRSDVPVEVTYDGAHVTAVRPSLRQVVSAWRGRWRHWLVLGSGLGLATWCAYLWVRFGDPLAWINAEAGWNQQPGPVTWAKVAYYDAVLAGRPIAVLLTANAAVLVLGFLMVRRVYRLFGWGYATFVLITLAIPAIGTKDFMGAGRYLLVVFPVFAAVADLLVRVRRTWLVPAILVLLAAGLTFATIAFTKGLPLQ